MLLLLFWHCCVPVVLVHAMATDGLICNTSVPGLHSCCKYWPVAHMHPPFTTSHEHKGSFQAVSFISVFRQRLSLLASALHTPHHAFCLAFFLLSSHSSKSPISFHNDPAHSKFPWWWVIQTGLSSDPAGLYQRAECVFPLGAADMSCTASLAACVHSCSWACQQRHFLIESLLIWGMQISVRLGLLYFHIAHSLVQTLLLVSSSSLSCMKFQPAPPYLIYPETRTAAFKPSSCRP